MFLQACMLVSVSPQALHQCQTDLVLDACFPSPFPHLYLPT